MMSRFVTLAVFSVLLCCAFVQPADSQERCGVLRPPCGENQCCALLPLLGRRCQYLGQEGERCGLGLASCPCMAGLTCNNFRCVDTRETTTEEPETTTDEPETTQEPATTTDEPETTTG